MGSFEVFVFIRPPPKYGVLPTDIEGNKPWSLSRPSLYLWEMKDH